MRVIVHFPAIKTYSQPSRIEAGKLFLKRKQKVHAKQLWMEGHGWALKTKDAATAKKFKALLDGLAGKSSKKKA